MSELLEHDGHLGSLTTAPGAQVWTRWVDVVLMDAAAVLGLLFAFPDWGAWSSSTTGGAAGTGHEPSMAPILLVGIGVLVAVAMALPAILLARRVWLRSPRPSWTTMGLAGVVLVATVAQANSIWALLCFLCSSGLMVIVGLPLSRFRTNATAVAS